MSNAYELTDLQAEAKRLSGDPRALVFCDDEGYSLFLPDSLTLLPLGRKSDAAMRKLRRIYAQMSRGAQRRPKKFSKPEMFTNIRLHLMLARFELMGTRVEIPGPLVAESERKDDGARDLLNIFSGLCSVDNEVIQAQKARGFDDGKALGEIRKLALKRRHQK